MKALLHIDQIIDNHAPATPCTAHEPSCILLNSSLHGELHQIGQKLSHTCLKSNLDATTVSNAFSNFSGESESVAL